MSDDLYLHTAVIEDQVGTWAVDWELIRAIVRSHKYNEALVKHGKIKETRQGSKYNPLDWGLPTLVTYEVDWKAVAKARDKDSEQIVHELQDRVYGGDPVRDLRVRVMEMLKETISYKEQYAKSTRAASRKAMANIHQAVETFEGYKAKAEFIRDASGEALLIGATLLPGGAAATAIVATAVGSGLKGVAKYQDTGEIGEALMETVGSVIFTAIPIAGKTVKTAASASRAQKAVTEGILVLTEAKFEVATSLISGDSVSQALAKGGLKVVTSVGSNRLVGALEKTQTMQKVLSKTGIPAEIRLSRRSAKTIARSEVVTGFGTGALNKYGVSKATAPLIDSLKTKKKAKKTAESVKKGSFRRLTGWNELCSSLKLLDRSVLMVRGHACAS